MGYHRVYHIQCVEHVLEDARHYKYVPMTMRLYSPSPLYRLVRGGPQGISIPRKEWGVLPCAAVPSSLQLAGYFSAAVLRGPAPALPCTIPGHLHPRREVCLLVFGGLYRKPGPTSAWTGFALPRRKGQVVFTWQGIIIAQVGYVAPELPIAGSRAWHQVMRHVPDLGEGCMPHNPGIGCTPAVILY